MKTFFTWLGCSLSALLLVVFLIGTLGQAKAAYNSFKVQCGSLVGTGYVMVWFDEQTYKIPVECKE